MSRDPRWAVTIGLCALAASTVVNVAGADRAVPRLSVHGGPVFPRSGDSGQTWHFGGEVEFPMAPGRSVAAMLDLIDRPENVTRWGQGYTAVKHEDVLGLVVMRFAGTRRIHPCAHLGAGLSHRSRREVNFQAQPGYVNSLALRTWTRTALAVGAGLEARVFGESALRAELSLIQFPGFWKNLTPVRISIVF